MPETFTVPVKGIGRRDYSKAVEYASQPTSRGRLARVNWGINFNGVPWIPFPWVYGWKIVFIDEEGHAVVAAPALPRHFYHMGITAKRAALIVVGCYVYADEAHADMWLPEACFGWCYGYGKAELSFTNGVKTEEGKVYSLLFAEYSEEASFDVFITINALLEEVAYGAR